MLGHPDAPSPVIALDPIGSDWLAGVVGILPDDLPSPPRSPAEVWMAEQYRWQEVRDQRPVVELVGGKAHRYFDGLVELRTPLDWTVTVNERSRAIRLGHATDDRDWSLDVRIGLDRPGSASRNLVDAWALSGRRVAHGQNPDRFVIDSYADNGLIFLRFPSWSRSRRTHVEGRIIITDLVDVSFDRYCVPEEMRRVRQQGIDLQAVLASLRIDGEPVLHQALAAGVQPIVRPYLPSGSQRRWYQDRASRFTADHQVVGVTTHDRWVELVAPAEGVTVDGLGVGLGPGWQLQGEADEDDGGRLRLVWSQPSAGTIRCQVKVLDVPDPITEVANAWFEPTREDRPEPEGIVYQLDRRAGFEGDVLLQESGV